MRDEAEKDLLVLEATSVAAGFRILNSLPADRSLRLLDAEPTGGGHFLILLRGLTSSLSALAKLNRDLLIDHELIENIHQDVLDATYSLAAPKLEESLIVLETETATAILSLAQTLTVEHSLKPIEIRVRKSGAAGAYAYFTGSTEQCALATEDARTRLKRTMRKGAAEFLNSPNQIVRQLLEGV